VGDWALQLEPVLQTLALTGSNNNGAEHALGGEGEAIGASVGAEVGSAESYRAKSAVQLEAPPRGRSLPSGDLPGGGTLGRLPAWLAVDRPIDLSRGKVTPSHRE
jgi:hypothetical protein